MLGREELAEREGFEPPIRLPVCRISSAVLSTTQPPLRNTRLGRKFTTHLQGRYVAKRAKTDKGARAYSSLRGYIRYERRYHADDRKRTDCPYRRRRTADPPLPAHGLRAQRLR